MTEDFGQGTATPALLIAEALRFRRTKPGPASASPSQCPFCYPAKCSGDYGHMGKTLLEVADLLDQARRKGIPRWRLRYGLETRTVSFDGDWLVPLPGLKR